jgi:hypothetical protein
VAIPNPKDILIRAPGRLSINPVALGAYPHGGLGLGPVKAISLKPGMRYKEIVAEEYAERVEVIAGDVGWAMAAVLRSYDSDALTRLFPVTAVGVSGAIVVRHPNELDANAARAGRLMSSAAITVVFTPDSPAHHPGAILHRAIPLVDEAAAMSLSLSSEWGLAVMFLPIRNVAGKSVSIGRVGDLAL